MKQRHLFIRLIQQQSLNAYQIDVYHSHTHTSRLRNNRFQRPRKYAAMHSGMHTAR